MLKNEVARYKEFGIMERYPPSTLSLLVSYYIQKWPAWVYMESEVELKQDT